MSRKTTGNLGFGLANECESLAEVVTVSPRSGMCSGSPSYSGEHLVVLFS